MSSSVSISIATNSLIAAAKGFGWFVTASPTLFAETVHSLADVANQVLLKVGEVRGRGRPTRAHPFGLGQEKFFWALVSAVSVFFVGCGINLYHGVHSYLHPEQGEPFSGLVLGLLVFALALECYTFVIALRELGGFRNISANRHNTTVLAVLLEDAVALIGILLTLIVGAVSWLVGPHPGFDALVAIGIGVLLGAMAIFLAALNRKLLIDTSDGEVDRLARHFLAQNELRKARVSSILVDDDRSIVFVAVLPGEARELMPRDTDALGEAIKAHVKAHTDKVVDAVFWRFPPDVKGGKA